MRDNVTNNKTTNDLTGRYYAGVIREAINSANSRNGNAKKITWNDVVIDEVFTPLFIDGVIRSSNNIDNSKNDKVSKSTVDESLVDEAVECGEVTNTANSENTTNSASEDFASFTMVKNGVTINISATPDDAGMVLHYAKRLI